MYCSLEKQLLYDWSGQCNYIKTKGKQIIPQQLISRNLKLPNVHNQGPSNPFLGQRVRNNSVHLFPFPETALRCSTIY